MMALNIDEIEKRWAQKSLALPWRFVSYACGWENPEPPEWAVRDSNGHTIFADSYPGDGAQVEAVAHAAEDIAFLIARVRELEAKVNP